MSLLSKLFGTTQHTRNVKHFEPLVAGINVLEPAIRALSDAEIKDKTAQFKRKVQASPNLESEKAVLKEILPEAFALVREAARRTLGQRHFDVQLMGGMVLNDGGIAEMRTGEGKTLVARLPAYLNALTGRGVHIITVNDYLSRRDAAWMGQIYDALGLTVAVINHETSFLYDAKHKNQEPQQSGPSDLPQVGTVTKSDTSTSSADPLDAERDLLGSFKVVHEFLRPISRREAYAADITYGTNTEFGFDYLRDNLEYSADRLRQREPHYAIVDEIDSILIDEARTPLIISAPPRNAGGTSRPVAGLVKGFVPAES